MNAAVSGYSFGSSVSIGGTASITVGNSAATSITALEGHLQELCALNQLLGGAVSRTSKLADKLFGCEPTPIKEDSEPKPLGERPLVAKIVDALDDAKELITSVHSHLERLERL